MKLNLTNLTERLYKELYPNPGRKDPANWNALTKHLREEIVRELCGFYGQDWRYHLESRYAGLDYSYQPHRTRLAQKPYHALLFKAADSLGVSGSDLNNICTWEGTWTDRKAYEDRHGVKIRDTTGDCVQSTWVDVAKIEQERAAASRVSRRRSFPGTIASTLRSETPNRSEHVQLQQWLSRRDESVEGNDGYVSADDDDPATNVPDEGEEDDEQGEYEEAPKDDVDMDDDGLDSLDAADDDLVRSVGHDLQRRLLAAAFARDNGQNASFDPAWEQWLAHQGVSLSPFPTTFLNSNAVDTGSTTPPLPPVNTVSIPLVISEVIRDPSLQPSIMLDHSSPEAHAYRAQFFDQISNMTY